MLNDALGFCSICQKWLDDKEFKLHPGKCSQHYRPEKARIQKAKDDLQEWIEMHDGIVPSEDFEAFEKEVKERQWFIKQAERVEKLTEIIARNLVAWDTSKDKKLGLLPEVYLSNRYWYQTLTGEEYIRFKAIKKFNIDD